MVRAAEGAGFSSLVVPDHLNDQLSPLPALAAAAMVTDHLRLGIHMACNDFRPPGLLAKEAATVQALSGGRLELGLGAGWLEDEYRNLGLAFDAPAVRIERLEESATVIGRLLAGGPVTFTGRHYECRDLEIRPVPAVPVPIVIGGGGRRVLSLAGRLADIVSVNTNNRDRHGLAATPDMRPAAVGQKIAWVRAAAGDRWGALEINVTVMVAAVTDDRRGYANEVAPRYGMTAEELLDTPFALIGSEAAIADSLQRFRAELGVSYFSIHSRFVPDLGPVVAELGLPTEAAG